MRFVFSIGLGLLAMGFCIVSVASPITTLSGRVVAVADGDSLTIEIEDGSRHKIRLAGIDAPERGQPYSRHARQQLKDLCLGKSAEVLVTAKDRYQRNVGEVQCEALNAGELMLSAGLAWAYMPDMARHQHYLELEKLARGSGLGLWLDTRPIPPWKWRRQNTPSQAQP